MYRCAMYGKEKDIDMIIALGDDIHAVDQYGRNTMHYACLAGNTKTAEKLLQLGVETDLGDNEGYTPLHWVSMCNSVEMVNFLYENSADMNVRDNQGNTPLHMACQRGQVQTVSTLLKYGADPLAQNDENQTPYEFMQDSDIGAGLKNKIEKTLVTIKARRTPVSSPVSSHQAPAKVSLTLVPSPPSKKNSSLTPTSKIESLHSGGLYRCKTIQKPSDANEM